MTSLKWIAASLLIVGGLMWMGSGNGTLSPSAFADDIPGVDNVQTMTWTTTFYGRVTSADGKRTWIRTERRLHAYRHPGQYRETMLDAKGQPLSVHITDNRAGRMLWLDVNAKKAVLKFSDQHDERGPFASVGDVIRERKFSESYHVKSVSLQGQKEIDKTQVNVVRAMIRNVEDQSELRIDYLFDVASKQLTGTWTPNEADLEFETAAGKNNKAEVEWSLEIAVGDLAHEIVLNPKLDASEFSLDPPAGYAFEKMAKPTVTEDEMIAYLGAAARFNDNKFPDSPYNAFDSDKFNAASLKELKARTAIEQSLIDIRDKIMMREIYRSPVKQFEEDQTKAGSLHYVGSGVTVGQAEKLVGWYQLRNGTKYRAIYGDLSIKDVTAAELPLDVSK